jgi:3-hydroxybutyryl-CoA dehydrogenase
MKLGTNYPRGPFEWANLIGAERITGLLMHLSSADPRYAPAPGMPDILRQKT